MSSILNQSALFQALHIHANVNLRSCERAVCEVGSSSGHKCQTTFGLSLSKPCPSSTSQGKGGASTGSARTAERSARKIKLGTARRSRRMRRRLFAGERLRALRQRAGLGQSAMAARLGFSVSYLSQLEN